MIDFDTCVQYILGREGLYVNDSGGPTKYGITLPILAEYQQVDKSTLSADNIKNLTREVAVDIYHKLFWTKLNLEQLPEDIRLICMDTAVNQGRPECGILLQEVVGAYPDGDIGPHTITHVKNYRGDLLTELTYKRMVSYTSDAGFSKYSHSWFTRSLLAYKHSVTFMGTN